MILCSDVVKVLSMYRANRPVFGHHYLWHTVFKHINRRNMHSAGLKPATLDPFRKPESQTMSFY